MTTYLKKIGARATVSQYAHFYAGTHDWRNPTVPLIKLRIAIRAAAWIPYKAQCFQNIWLLI